MKKRITDLTAQELEAAASTAWFEASEAALKKGATVVGREGSKIVKTYPNGRVEVLGDAKPLVEAGGKKIPRIGQTRRSA